jgi:hypothetical protein
VLAGADHPCAVCGGGAVSAEYVSGKRAEGHALLEACKDWGRAKIHVDDLANRQFYTVNFFCILFG